MDFFFLTDQDHSDSDSDDFNDSIVFAEVLHSFQPVGTQELALEKGSLVEIIKRDPGPWWWGRIKHDAVILHDSVDLRHEGWFPKDFVRVNIFLFPNFHIDLQNCFFFR